MSEALQHLAILADEIGPRPATSEAEHRASLHVEGVLAAHGLEPQIQEFDAPRTYGWAYILYNLLSIAAAVLAGPLVLNGRLAWPAFVLAALVAILLFSDLNTRWGLSHLMPKGPSQNVVGRLAPRGRPEHVKKIVLVAHVDTARSSLVFSPGLVRQFPFFFGLMKFSTALVALLLLAFALPLPVSARIDTYIWYAALVFSAYLLIVLLMTLHRELFMPFVHGANDNASGVAVLLGVAEELAPKSPSSGWAALGETQAFEVVRRTPEAAVEADVVPEGAVLRYSPAEAPADEDFSAAEEDFSWVEPEGEPVERPGRNQVLFEFETIQFDALGDIESGAEERSERADRWERERPERRERERDELREAAAPEREEPPRRRGLLGGLGRGKDEEGAHRRSHARESDEDLNGWLGVDEEFDARKTGKKIGSWDNFGDSDDDDDFGWKGGSAGGDPLGDPDFSWQEASRIRKRVEERSDPELAEKEVWFVATGAQETGTWGMQEFLSAYGPELRDALIINIDSVGAGQLSWVVAEGMGRRRQASSRLTGLARRVSREEQIVVKPKAYRGLSTDTYPALMRGFKAMSIMAFDARGLPANWHWRTDTIDEIEPDLLDRAVKLVAEMVRKA
ncbi:MAG: M28 family peptidase [Coriobacteriia bacterium]